MYVIKCLIKDDNTYLSEIFWNGEYRQCWLSSKREEIIKYNIKKDAIGMLREIKKRNPGNRELHKRLIIEKIDMV